MHTFFTGAELRLGGAGHHDARHHHPGRQRHQRRHQQMPQRAGQHILENGGI